MLDLETVGTVLVDKYNVAALLDSTPRRCTTRTLRRELPWQKRGRRLVVPLSAVIARAGEAQKKLKTP